MQLLLEAGADPNDSREGRGTVLQVAAYWDNELIVKHLLGAKADVNLRCEGHFRGVRHPLKCVQFQLSANYVIEKMQYSFASGSFGIDLWLAERKRESGATFAGGGC